MIYCLRRGAAGVEVSRRLISGGETVSGEGASGVRRAVAQSRGGNYLLHRAKSTPDNWFSLPVRPHNALLGGGLCLDGYLGLLQVLD